MSTVATSRRYGYFWLITGWLGWVTGLVMGLGPQIYLILGRLGSDPPFWKLPVLLWISFGGVLVARAGSAGRVIGRSRLTRAATMPGPDETFVLYLRSFDQDAKRGQLERNRIPASEMFTPLTFAVPLFFGGKTLEEQVIAVLGKCGRVLALGKPGESLPPPGARRLYLPTDDWQRPVRDLMSRARLVVIFMDPTPGTVWEFNEALKRVAPQRLLLVAPADKERYNRFRARVAPAALPAYRPPVRESNYARRDAVSGLIHYPEAGRPVLTPLATFALWDVLRVGVSTAAAPALKNLSAYEATLPLDPVRAVRRSRSRILRVVGHLTCLYGFTQVWFGIGIRHFHLTGTLHWTDILWGAAAFAVGQLELAIARDFRRRAAPLPRGGAGARG